MARLHENSVTIAGMLATGLVVIGAGLWIRQLYLATWARVLLNELVGFTLIACGYLAFQYLNGKLLRMSSKHLPNTQKKNPQDYENTTSQGVED